MLCMSSSLVRPWHRVGMDSLFTVISSFHPTLRGLRYSLAHSLGIAFGYCDSFYFLRTLGFWTLKTSQKQILGKSLRNLGYFLVCVKRGLEITIPCLLEAESELVTRQLKSVVT